MADNPRKAAAGRLVERAIPQPTDAERDAALAAELDKVRAALAATEPGSAEEANFLAREEDILQLRRPLVAAMKEREQVLKAQEAPQYAPPETFASESRKAAQRQYPELMRMLSQVPGFRPDIVDVPPETTRPVVREEEKK